MKLQLLHFSLGLGCCLALVFLPHGLAGASPLDEMRSIWVVRERTGHPNPAQAAEKRNTRTEFTLKRHLIFRSLRTESTDWDISTRQSLNFADGTVQLEGLRTGTGVQIHETEGGFKSLDRRQERLKVVYGRRMGTRLDLGMEMQVRDSSAIPAEGTGGFRAYFRQWEMAGYIGRHAVSRLSEIRQAEDRIELQTQVYHVEKGVSLQGEPAAWAKIALEGQWGRFEPTRAASGYTADLNGGWQVLQGTLESRVSRVFAVVGTLRHRRLDGSPEAHLSGTRFARSQLHLKDLSGSLWLRRTMARERYVEAGFFASRGQGELSLGRLDSWPFSNSFFSLIGGKDWCFWGDGDFNLNGAGVRSGQQGRRWKIVTDTRLFRVRGQVNGVSRQRTKLNFGSLFFPKIKRQQRQGLAEVMDLQVHAEWRLARWGIRSSFAQIIPLRVEFESEGAGGRKSGGRQYALSLVFWPESG